MRYRTGIVWQVAILAGCLQFACAAPETRQPLDVTEEIQAANEQFVAAFASSDAEALTALYTQDGKLLPPNSDVVAGTAAIQGFWQMVMEAGVAQAQLTTEEAEGFDGTAFEVGGYSLYDSDGNMIDEGKYVVIWKRTEDGWRLHRDIWNSSVPIASE
ncbi:MAG: DUF3225 domain-containing protein [Gemmatimonadota bacterium]|nr:MAG: DUF3225 domain-containing protein [Gemmatimonadota bacterium]